MGFFVLLILAGLALFAFMVVRAKREMNHAMGVGVHNVKAKNCKQRGSRDFSYTISTDEWGGPVFYAEYCDLCGGPRPTSLDDL